MYKCEGVQIKTRANLKRYFDYDQIIGILAGNDTEEDFTEIVTEGEPLKTVLKNKAAEVPGYFTEIDDNPGTWQIGDGKGFLKKLNLDPGKYQTALNSCVQDDIILSTDQAYELLLAFALFAYAGYVPEENDGYLHQVKQRLNLRTEQLQEMMVKPSGTICLTEEETVFPSFSESMEMGTPELVVIRNESEALAVVRLENCPLQRHLNKQEEVMALTIGGKIAVFFPQICADDNQIIFNDKDKTIAMNTSGEETGCLEKQAKLFAVSRDYGFFSTDRDGKHISGTLPDDINICWLSAALDDYGYLTFEGKYVGAKPRDMWKNLICFDLSTGGGAAIKTNRDAINGNGKILAKNTAAVSTFGDHYILLLMDGSVQADVKLPGGNEFRAVCADANGYWLSTDEELIRLDNEGKEIFRGQTPMDEIVRDGLGQTVYGKGTDGKIYCLQ